MIEMVAAHFVIQFIVMSIQTMILMFIAYVLYFNPMDGSLTLLMGLLLLVENLGMCYGEKTFESFIKTCNYVISYL